MNLKEISITEFLANPKELLCLGELVFQQALVTEKLILDEFKKRSDLGSGVSALHEHAHIPSSFYATLRDKKILYLTFHMIIPEEGHPRVKVFIRKKLTNPNVKNLKRVSLS